MNWHTDLVGLFMPICLAVGAFIVLLVGKKLLDARRVPKDLAEWGPVLEQTYLRIVHKNRELMEAVREAELTRRQLPKEYQAILDQVLMLARLMEQASYEAAVANGTVPRYWFGGPTSEQPVMNDPPPANTEPAAHDGGTDNVVPITGTHATHSWIGGTLLRRIVG